MRTNSNTINEIFISDIDVDNKVTKRCCQHDIRDGEELFTHPMFNTMDTIITNININININGNIRELQSCVAEWMPKPFWSTMEPIELYPEPEVIPMEICEDYDDLEDLEDQFRDMSI